MIAFSLPLFSEGRLAALGLALALLLPPVLWQPATGQPTSLPAESTYTVQPKVRLQVGAVSSDDATPQPEGFDVFDARLGLEGTAAAKRVAFEIDADVSDGFELKDARVAYTLAPPLTVHAGRFRVPYSAGALLSSGATPFVTRPDAVEAVELGRATGLMVEATSESLPITVMGGVFDAPAGSTTTQDRSHFLYAGRLQSEVSLGALKTTIGVNAAYRSPDAAGQGSTRFGADLRVDGRQAFVIVEALGRTAARSKGTAAGTVAEGYVTAGYVTAGYVTTGVRVSGRHVVRGRVDHVAHRGPMPDRAASDDLFEGTRIGLGYTFRPAPPVRVELDLIAPAREDALSDASVLAKLQFDL